MQSPDETTRLLSQAASNSTAVTQSPPAGPAMLHSFQQATKQPDFLLSPDALIKLARSGDASAQYLVGAGLRSGNFGWTINNVEGEKWLVAAKNNGNSPGALCAQGLCYEEGIGGVLIKSLDKAQECYTEAARQKYIPGMCALAFILVNRAITTTQSRTPDPQYPGRHPDIIVTHTHKDETLLSLAISYATPAAEAGYAPTLNLIGYCYEKGYGVQKSDAEAFKLYSMAAEKGCAAARVNLGLCYEYGRGTTANLEMTRRWYEAAAAQGHERGRQKLQDLNINPCVSLRIFCRGGCR